MGFMKRGTAAAAIFLLVSGIPSAAFAQPPKAFLHSGDERQRGKSYWFSQGRRAGEGMCSVLHADAPREWPPALIHRTDEQLRIGFRKDQKPEVVRLRDYNAVTPEDAPAGDGQEVDFRLRPKRKGGDVVGWRVLFKRGEPGDHYLYMFVRWEGRHRCAFQEAPYDFHIRTVPV